MKSTRLNKKYDVFQNDRYLLSFGDTRYEQYHDQFGIYSHLDHHDKERRRLYRDRHKNTNINNPNYPAFWSYHYLW